MSGFKYHFSLCECGRPKKDTSKRCSVCSSAHPSEKFQKAYDLCPSCGGPKSKRSRFCRHCAHPDHLGEDFSKRPWYGSAPDYSGVPENYLCAFAGFLMGEGCIAMGQDPNWAPRIDIGIHIDDIGVLELAQSYFGGSIHRFSKRPLASWRLQSLLPVRELLLRVRPYASLLSAIKINDIDIALGYIEWRLSRPHHLGPSDRQVQLEWKARLKAVKVRSSL